MTSNTPGCVCTVKRRGNQNFVVKYRDDHDSARWKLVAVGRDKRRGYKVHSGLTVGEGDITVVAPAPTFAAGSTIVHNGLSHIVLEDQGDTVELGVPEHRVPTGGTELTRIPAGNTSTPSKADLVLEDMT